MNTITSQRLSVGFSRLTRLGAALLVLAGSVFPAFAAAGDLDSTFGILTSGLNYTDFAAAHNNDRITSLALQTDELIVAAGEANSHFALARYGTNGLLDTVGFGSPNGTVTTVIETTSIANDVAVQTDGMIVAAGSSNNGLRDFFIVARYTSAGVLDTAGFNAPTGYITSTFTTGNDVATSLVIQPDGKIVVAGYTNNQFIVARYTTAGLLDTAGFNTPNGYLTFAIGSKDAAQDVDLQSDGKIILAGHADTGTSDDFAVARLTTTGILDLTFNSGIGWITTDFPTQQIDLGNAVAVQPDDKIVVGGSTDTGPTLIFALLRYNPDGGLDTGFGTNGRVTTAIDTKNEAFAIALQPTGRIVLAGTSINATTTEDFALARYTRAGILDSTFGSAGIVTTNIGDGLDSGAVTADLAQASLAQSDGKIVVAGFSDHPVAFGDDNFAIARYESPNNAPTIAGFSKSGTEDTDIGFAFADFNTDFLDTDGDSLVKIQVNVLPVNGTLRLSSVDLTAGQEIPGGSLGALTYHPDADFNGSDSFDWNGSDGQDYAIADVQVDITLSAVNDAPLNSLPAPFSANEDLSQNGLVFGVSDPDAGSAVDCSFTISATHGTLTLASTTGLSLVSGANGSHTMNFQGMMADIDAALDDIDYLPDGNYHGSDSITLITRDNGSTGSGGALQDSDSLAITVNSVNDAPSFTKGSNITVFQDVPAQTFTAWATTISAGPADESGQILSFEVVTNTNPSLFSTLPAVDSAGALTFTPAARANGTANITLKIHDNGGTANGGLDVSTEQTFTITLTPLFYIYLPSIGK